MGALGALSSDDTFSFISDSPLGDYLELAEGEGDCKLFRELFPFLKRPRIPDFTLWFILFWLSFSPSVLTLELPWDPENFSFCCFFVALKSIL